MSLRPISRPLVAAALAAGLLAAPAAQARVADEGPRAAAQTSSLAGTVTPKQDLRGEHARDAANASSLAGTVTPKQDLRGEHARDAARLTPMPMTLPADPEKALPAPATDDDGPQTWLILLGLTGAAIAAGGTAGAVRHRRLA
jgi:hypothetical protein